MQTPDTIEGFLTETIMARITDKIGKMPAHNYNPIYSAVLETLNKHLPEIRAAGAGLTRKQFIMSDFN